MGWDRNHGDGRINQPQTIIWATKLKRRGLRPNNPGMGRKVNRRSLKEGKKQISEEESGGGRPPSTGNSTCAVPEAEGSGTAACEPGLLSHDQRVPIRESHRL